MDLQTHSFVPLTQEENSLTLHCKEMDIPASETKTEHFVFLYGAAIWTRIGMSAHSGKEVIFMCWHLKCMTAHWQKVWRKQKLIKD